MPIFRRISKEKLGESNGAISPFATSALRIERAIIREVKGGIDYISNAGIDFPVYLFLTVTGVRGVVLAEDGSGGFNIANLTATKYGINEDVILLPNLEIAIPDDIPQFLKPAFDVLWQASGRAFSPHFDENGKYKH